jgi:TPR repeat protein
VDEARARAAAASQQKLYDEALAYHEALDFPAALPLFKLAGEAGHGPSCGFAALYFIEGRGVCRDCSEAWGWASKGTELQDAGSIGVKARYVFDDL